MATTTDPRELANAYHLTVEQIASAQRFVNAVNNQVFYLVRSQSVPDTDYKVIYNKEYRVLQCLPHNGQPCPASAAGRGCWHKRAVMAAEVQYKRDRKAERAIEASAQYQQEQAQQALYTAQINLKS